MTLLEKFENCLIFPCLTQCGDTLIGVIKPICSSIKLVTPNGPFKSNFDEKECSMYAKTQISVILTNGDSRCLKFMAKH